MTGQIADLADDFISHAQRRLTGRLAPEFGQGASGGVAVAEVGERGMPHELDGACCIGGGPIEVWDVTAEAPRELDDPPTCDLGPPLWIGEV